MNIIDKATYFYIKNIKRWMECPVCHKKMTFSKSIKSWVCESCNYRLLQSEFLDDFVLWFCDGCDTYLNVQEGFDRKGKRWVCTECGFDNDITFDNIKGECKDCGKLLNNPDATICGECRNMRKQKTKEKIKTAAKVVGAVATVAGVAYVVANSEEKSSDSDACFTYDLENVLSEKKCANCGNTDETSMFDEGDTIYCANCMHRTLKATGKDDVVECPYCHRMRDAKAMYCRHCNDSTWKESTTEEFEEINKILREMEC